MGTSMNTCCCTLLSDLRSRGPELQEEIPQGKIYFWPKAGFLGHTAPPSRSSFCVKAPLPWQSLPTLPTPYLASFDVGEQLFLYLTDQRGRVCCAPK